MNSPQISQHRRLSINQSTAGLKWTGHVHIVVVELWSKKGKLVDENMQFIFYRYRMEISNKWSGVFMATGSERLKKREKVIITCMQVAQVSSGPVECIAESSNSLCRFQSQIASVSNCILTFNTAVKCSFTPLGTPFLLIGATAHA